MADFFWVGQTPTVGAKLNPFSWNIQSNWRQRAAIAEAVQVTDAARIPGGAPGVQDNVYIGIPMEQKVNGVWVQLVAKSPLLFGGCTGAINGLGTYVTGGATWAHAASMTSAGSTYPLSALIIGEDRGSKSYEDEFRTNGITFRTYYPFPVLGGGVTGGNGYFTDINHIKQWFTSQYPNINADTIFSSANLALYPLRDNLRVKTQQIRDNAFSYAPATQYDPGNLTIALCIPRSFAPGQSVASTTYIKSSQGNVRTYLKNSVINAFHNISSHRYYDIGNETINVAHSSPAIFDKCVINYYEGYFHDAVTIKPNCYVTYANLLSPEKPSCYYGMLPAANFKNYIKIAGVYGITYTYKYLGLPNASTDTDGKLNIGSINYSPDCYQFAQGIGGHLRGNYEAQYLALSIGDVSGVTSYFKQIHCTGNILGFKGVVIADDVRLNASYMVYDSESPTSKDMINIKYLTLANSSTLNVAYSPNFNNWRFGDVPTGQTMVQGGIYTEGTGYFVGSPGVKLYNEFYYYGASVAPSRDGKVWRDTGHEIYTGITATGAPAEAN